MKKIIAIIIAMILTLVIGISLFIYTRPVDWDAGACGGGYSTYIFNKYNKTLTQDFLNKLGEEKDNIISVEAVEGSQSVQWEDDTIFLQYDINCKHNENGIITEKVSFIGKRIWIDTFKWSESTIN